MATVSFPWHNLIKNYGELFPVLNDTSIDKENHDHFCGGYTLHFSQKYNFN